MKDSDFKIIVLCMLFLILVFSSAIYRTAQAGVYLDLGLSYVDEFGVIERGSVTFGNYTISAEVSATVDVQDLVPMVRFGYLWRGFGIEYDTIGVPNQDFSRINIFYRWEF